MKKTKAQSPEKTRPSNDSSKNSLPPIKLPKPVFTGGQSFMNVLKKRKTVREIGDKKITLQTLSALLWAACGVNRKKGPFGVAGRTAGSASNSQEIDVYLLRFPVAAL